MDYKEAKQKSEKILVKGDNAYQYNESQAKFAKDIIGKSFVTKAGKVVEVVEHTSNYTDDKGRLHNNNNLIIKMGNNYDAVAGVWFIAHIERGSFKAI